MRAGNILVTVILLVLILASLGAAAFFYLSLDEEKSKTRLASTNSEALALMIDKLKDDLADSKSAQKSADEENESLQEEVTVLTSSTEHSKLAQRLLEDQVKEMMGKEGALKVKLEEAMKSAQEQIKLKEEEVEAKIKAEEVKLLLKQEVLRKQAQSSEVLMQSMLKQNRTLQTQLMKNKLVLEEIHRDKIGSELLQSKDDLKETEVKLQNMITENEKLMTTFHELEDEKSDAEKELAQFQEELKNQTAKFHYNLGLVYDQAKRFEEAAEEYENALELLPDDPDTHYNLGVLYDEGIKNNKKAIYHYKSYLELKPGAGDADYVKRWIEKAERRLNWGKLELFR